MHSDIYIIYLRIYLILLILCKKEIHTIAQIAKSLFRMIKNIKRIIVQISTDIILEED